MARPARQLVRPRQRALHLDEWDAACDLPPERDDDEETKGKKRFEALFAAQCRAYMLPEPERQHRFAQAAMGKLWRFDFSWRQYMVAVEIQGIVMKRIAGKWYTTGAHADAAGMRKDHEKHNAAILLGWSVLQFTQGEIKPKRAIESTMRVLASRGWRAPE